VLLSHKKNVGQNHNKKTANQSFENVEKIRDLGKAVTYKNCMHGEIKSRLISRNARNNLVQNIHFLTCYQGM